MVNRFSDWTWRKEYWLTLSMHKRSRDGVIFLKKKNLHTKIWEIHIKNFNKKKYYAIIFNIFLFKSDSNIYERNLCKSYNSLLLYLKGLNLNLEILLAILKYKAFLNINLRPIKDLDHPKHPIIIRPTNPYLYYLYYWFILIIYGYFL